MRGIVCATLLTLISGWPSNWSMLGATGISSHDSPPQPSAALQSTSIDMGVPHGYSFHVKPDTAIANALEEDKLDHWGFVIYRCTYGSQEKWDKFLALAKQEARDYLERWGTGDLSVYDKMDWTVIEDAETLNGASILDATRKFDAWVKADGRAEMQHITSPDTWRSCAPRYQFFMYVDEESLESVVDDERARDRASGYFCKVVFPSSVFIREESRVAGVIPDDQDPLDEQLELLDSIKKIELGSLVSLYVTLLDPNMWYYIYVDVDYDHVGIALV